MAPLPVFEPYVLTPADHAIPPHHIAVFLTFHLDEPASAVPILEAGAERLIRRLPFLGGNVAPSTRLPQKENVLEVQPPSDEFLLQHPIFRERYHQEFIWPDNGGPAVDYDLISNEMFAPIPFTPAGKNPSPILRIQANVMRDGIILCFNFHHSTMDGLGIATVIEAFAACCRAETEHISLPTSPAEEQESRRLMFEAASAPKLRRTPKKDPAALKKLMSNLVVQDLVSRKLVFDAKKLSQLKEACLAALHGQSNAQIIPISSNTVLSAALWLSFIRTRYGPLAARDESVPVESRAITFSEFRSKLQPGLPTSYIGNALVINGLRTPIAPLISSPVNRACHLSCTSTGIDHHDIRLLVNIVKHIHGVVHSVTDKRARDMMSIIAASDDWSPRLNIFDLGLSSLRNLKFYGLDFGRRLGPVKDFDLPHSHAKGFMWVMPARYNDRTCPWEVRLTLETAIMQRFQQDSLIKWLGGDDASKYKRACDSFRPHRQRGLSWKPATEYFSKRWNGSLAKAGNILKRLLR